MENDFIRVVMCDNKLTSTEKNVIILYLINFYDGLSNSYLNYKYYSDYLDLSIRTIYSCFKKLVKLGYLVKNDFFYSLDKGMLEIVWGL